MGLWYTLSWLLIWCITMLMWWECSIISSCDKVCPYEILVCHTSDVTALYTVQCQYFILVYVIIVQMKTFCSFVLWFKLYRHSKYVWSFHICIFTTRLWKKQLRHNSLFLSVLHDISHCMDMYTDQPCNGNAHLRCPGHYRPQSGLESPATASLWAIVEYLPQLDALSEGPHVLVVLINKYHKIYLQHPWNGFDCTQALLWIEEGIITHLVSRTHK